MFQNTKAGGYREISAPIASLKQAQYWIQEHFGSDAAVGLCTWFCRWTFNRDKCDAARSKGVVIDPDVQDFFPSITPNVS